MKKFFAAILALALAFSAFTVVTSAAGTNPEYALEFTETAPTVDGVVSADEYGAPIVSWAVSDGETDGIVLALYEIEDDPALSIDFYATWTETDLYLAWEVHTKYDSRIPEYIEDGYMYEYCCVQFLLTPGAPDNSVTQFQTEEWSGDYLELGLCLRNSDYADLVCWSQPASAGLGLDRSEWDFAGSRDDDEEITVYECRLPLEHLGFGAIGDGAQFGLTWAVGAQENYETVTKGLVEWQDAIVGGKNADNAAVMTLTGSGKELPDEPVENDFLYEIVDGKATVTGYTGNDGTVTIPAELGGCPVTAIGNFAFSYREDLTAVTLPEGVTSIGIAAFQECPYLERINIPEGVTYIGTSAFAYCFSLQNVTLPDSLRTLDDAAFAVCDSFTTVTIPKNVTKIGRHAFYNCGNLTSIKVAEENTVYYVKNNFLIEKATGRLLLALSKASSVTIPEEVIIIGTEAFSNCSNMTSVTIPNSVTTIEDSAFYGCRKLASVTIPASVTTMGYNIFQSCDALTDIYCEAWEQPAGWSKEWLEDCNATVHWSDAPDLALGDLNGNGKIDAADYMLLKRYVLGTKELTDEQLAAADVNKDGKINATDYMLVKRHVLGSYTIVA